MGVAARQYPEFKEILLVGMGVQAMIAITSCRTKPILATIWWVSPVGTLVADAAENRANNTVYEVFVRSFYDGNGDGIGDLNGLTQKLDYFNDGNSDTDQDLEVGILWLMPIMPSPSYHGYDVTDYLDVNSQYGSLADFDRFVEAAHNRGIRVILDVPLNHTSDEHEWFAEAVGDPAGRPTPSSITWTPWTKITVRLARQDERRWSTGALLRRLRFGDAGPQSPGTGST